MILFFRKHTFLLKSFLLYCIVSILGQTLAPTIAYALTGGPSSADVIGHNSGANGHNVNMVNGSFSYSVPITSIPDYPMSITYNTGSAMDEDATAFGFGFNGFSGAILRSAVGIPDDVNGGLTNYNIENNDNWDASIEIGDQGLNGTFGYNSTTGIYTRVGNKVEGNFNYMGIQLSAGASMNTSSTIGDVNMSYNYSISYLNLIGFAGGGGATGTIGNSSSNCGITILGMSIKEYKDLGDNLKAMFASPLQSSSVVMPFSARIASSPSIVTDNYGTSIVLPFGTYSDINPAYSGMNKNYSAYGYANTKNVIRNNPYHLYDIAIEGESSFDESDRHNPTYMQKDVFVVNCAGLSGSMQMNNDLWGTVSRNTAIGYHKDVSVFMTSRETNTTTRWDRNFHPSQNMDIDLLDFLKNDKPQNTDKTLIKETQTYDLTSGNSFKDENPDLRFRGDLAGSQYHTTDPLSHTGPGVFNFVEISGSGTGKDLILMGLKDLLPEYVPTKLGDFKKPEQKAQSTRIQKYSVKDILNSLDLKAKTNYSEAKLNVATPTQDIYNFNNSIFSHYKPKNAYGTDGVLTTENTNKFSTYTHLQELQSTESAYFGELIADIRVTNAEGSTYIFNLPVFNKGSKEQMMLGKKTEAPYINDTKNEYSNKDRTNLTQTVRNGCTVKTDLYKYPYAWMLTAMVGNDYIDFDNIPGPSDGDLGHWTKFNYVKAADNYNWRFPFAGMNHMPGGLENYNDDMYTVSFGQKEVYYLASIESSDYVCKYNYAKRHDGIDAAGFVNGGAINSLNSSDFYDKVQDATILGTNRQYAVSSIDLYKKDHTSDFSNSNKTDNSGLKKVRSTVFSYDYSICPNLINNYNVVNPGSIKIKDVPYHVLYSPGNNTPIETGKLTLRKVQHFAYDENDVAHALPSTNLKYAFDASQNSDGNIHSEFNPDYDPKAVDSWGSYNSSNVTKYGNIKRYGLYSEISKSKADLNAKVYTLSQVDLPTGGSLKIDYEANGYSKVQQYRAFSMRKIINVETKASPHTSFLTVDITDLHADGKDIKELVKVWDDLYAQVAYYQDQRITNPNDLLLISSKTRCMSIDPTIITKLVNGETRYFQTVELANYTAQGYTVLNSGAREYLYSLNSNKGKATREALGSSSAACGDVKNYDNDYASLKKRTLDQCFRRMTSNADNFMNHSEKKVQDKFYECYGFPGLSTTGTGGSPVFPELSYLRTPVYKEKYTGVRVKAVTMTDNFQYATADAAPGYKESSNSYTTNYTYCDEYGNSYGVVSTEPGSNASNVLDDLEVKGKGFLPSPAILFRKVQVSNGYKNTDKSLPFISRKKGYTEYEYYTPADDGLSYNNFLKSNQLLEAPIHTDTRFMMFSYVLWKTFPFKWPWEVFKKKKRYITIPFGIIPVSVEWRRKDKYQTQSYSYLDYADIFGKPKAVRTFTEGVTAATTEQKFEYYKPNENLTVLKGGGTTTAKPDPFDNTTSYSMRPGLIEQSWSEAYRTENINSKFFLLFLYSQSNTHHVQTNMKQLYVPPVLKSITNSANGITSTASFDKFDYYTGVPVEATHTDPQGNVKTNRVVPAYWTTPTLGPSFENASYKNNLTPSSAEYEYLGKPVDNKLLAASATEWTKTDYQFIESVVLEKRELVTDNTGISAKFKVLTPTQLTNVYTSNNVHVPLKQWVYKTNLNADGTYQSFTNFNHLSSSQASSWQCASATTKFDAHLNAVESKDILGKYVSAHIGYNYSHGVSKTANVSWAGSVHEGAEVMYATSSATTLLDDHRVQLVGAIRSSSTCLEETKTLNPLSIQGINLNVVKWCKPATIQPHTVFAKVNVSITSTTLGNYYEELRLCYNDNGNVYVKTPQGKNFDGYFIVPIGNNGTCDQFEMVFDPSVVSITSVVAENTAAGAVILYKKYSSCNQVAKTYTLASSGCLDGKDFIHTGNYAFTLKNQRVGTIVTITKASLPASEYERGYKAMVWVHTSSPAETQLKVIIGALTKSVSMNEAFVTAGNWKLLRVDITKEELAVSNGFQVMVKNNATGNSTAIYDDFRVLPANAAINVSVNDPVLGRLTATLSDDNFATWYTYDGRGRITKVETEIENIGRNQVKKMLYNDQKKN